MKKPTKAQRIYRDLRDQIDSGELPPGTLLSRVKDFAAELGVSPETVRSAYKMLESDGVLRSTKRRGSEVIALQPRRRITRGVEITRDPARGYIFPAAARPDEPWVTHGRPFRKTLPAPASVTEQFGLPPDSNVLRRRRVTSPAGDPPFQLVDTWISPSAVEDAPRVDEPSPGPGGYLDRVEEAGHGPLSWKERIRARMPDREEAKALGIAQSIPVLETMIIGTSARTHVPVEVTIRVIPSDRVELVSQLRRVDQAQWPVAPVVASPK